MLKKIVFLFLAFISVLFLDISLSYVLNIDSRFIPDFFLVLVFFYSLYENDMSSMFVAFFLGIFKNIFDLDIFGLNSLLYLLIVFFIKYILPRIYRDNLVSILLILFCCSIAFYFSKYIFYLAINQKISFEYFYFVKALTTVVICPFIFKIFFRLQHQEYDLF